ncbi:DUF262 domain-containing protein [Nonomuraea sp. SYSU D8015]|uniref:DUF262 domain-containing protein n=1 Tax=Nonomuraea sp. SYSU D8015 TaxID=2593644 RepID=UPI001660AD6C|nr:DUF262 domain-containing protein [Nonomuraea sp. SYSU D8015]
MTRHTVKPIELLKLSPTNEPLTQLINQWRRGTLAWDPPHVPYQRAPVWTLDQQIALIESLLKGIPIPAIISNNRGSRRPGGEKLPTRVIIDGQQRLTTMRRWLDNEFMVPASWFPSADVIRVTTIEPGTALAEEYGDTGPYLHFQDLHDEAQITFDLVALPVAEAHVRTIEEEAAIYLRVNGYGTAQTNEDIARAARIAEGDE